MCQGFITSNEMIYNPSDMGAGKGNELLEYLCQKLNQHMFQYLCAIETAGGGTFFPKFPVSSAKSEMNDDWRENYHQAWSI